MKGLTHPAELVGAAAITLAAIGGFFQLEKTQRTSNVQSFATIYLVLMCIGEMYYL